MQEPESIMSLTGSSAPPKRKRRERTVYSKEQLEALKEAFLKNEYPSYQARLRLAARLHVDEHRVQVWFKNRRAQRSRLERRQAEGGHQRAPGTPAPVPECAAAAASPHFPDGPGFYSRPPPPSPAEVLLAPEPGISSCGRGTWVPAQGVHVYGRAAPTPAPDWPQDPDASNYGPDPLPLPDCALMFSSQELFSEHSSSLNSVSPVDKNDLGSRQFMNL